MRSAAEIRRQLYPDVEFVPNRLCPLSPSGEQDDAECRYSWWRHAGVADGEDEPDDAVPYDIWSCGRCGMAFTDPMPSEATTPELYSDRSSRDFKSSEPELVSRVRRFSAQQGLKRILPRVVGGRTPARALDFACGNGNWSLALGRELGASEVFATDFHDEPPPALAEGVVTYAPYGAMAGGKFDESFDLIFARHVLEHSHRPREMVELWRRLLAPGGAVVVEVPHFGSPLRRLFGRHWEMYYTPYHPIHFRPESLERLLTHAGLRVDAVEPSEIPILGRDLQNVLRRERYGIDLLLTNLLLAPVQMLVGKLTRTGVCLRAIAVRPAANSQDRT